MTVTYQSQNSAFMNDVLRKARVMIGRVYKLLTMLFLAVGNVVFADNHMAQSLDLKIIIERLIEYV